MDQPLPTTPRVLQDGQLEVREGHLVPVLAQPQNRRLLVLNSLALSHLTVGQTLVLHLEGGEPQVITLEAIDRLALLVRYQEGALEL